MTDITPADWESRRHTGLLARIARHPGLASEADRLRRPARLHHHLVPRRSAPLKGTLENKFVIPGSDAQKATDLLEAKFGERNGAILQVVYEANSTAELDTPERARGDRQHRSPAPRKAEYGDRGHRPVRRRQPAASRRRDPSIGYAEVQFSKDGFELKRSKIVELEDDDGRRRSSKAGIHAEFTGDADQAPPEQGTSEMLGIRGRAARAADRLPHDRRGRRADRCSRCMSVGTAFGLLYLLANLTDFNTITPILVSMIGIGVGIDYTLFIVTRFRQALHDGMPPRAAAAYASATAGRAVIFAGVTVAISITGLAVIGIPFITKLGMGGALGVLTAVLYATFLLPGPAGADRPQDRSPQGAGPARERRVRGGTRRHAARPLGRHDRARARACC